MKVDRNKIPCLEILSWRFALNGEHYYGYICYYDQDGEFVKYQLEYPLSKEEAHLLNIKDGEGSDWVEGESSRRYFSEEDVIEDARQFFHTTLKPQGYQMLREGGFATAQPEPIVAWASEYKEVAEKFNDLYKEGGDWNWDKDEELLETLQAEFEGYFV